MEKANRLLLTCEHGGCRVPAAYRRLFRGQRRVLTSHRGYDPGSLELGRSLARRLQAPLIASTVTRLLVELNRSPRHSRLFSEFTAGLDAATKQAILREFYDPHRAAVEHWIDDALARGCVALHVGVHTFTPIWHGRARNADIGLLYDPARPWERRWARAWREALRERRPDLRVRRNYPYLGRSDGLTTRLRRRFDARCYAGLELEVNQRWPQRGGAAWRALQQDLAHALHDSLGSV